MIEKTLILRNALVHLTQALEVTVNSSTDPVCRQIGRQHLDLAHAYQNRISVVREDIERVVAQAMANKILNYSQQVEKYARQNEWRRVLEQSRYTLSALPGEPGSDPLQIPPLPWE